MRVAHSVVDLPADGGNSLPVLILDPGEVSLLALAWARHLSVGTNASPMQVWKCISAVGLFHDFYVLVENRRPIGEDTLGYLLARFYEARRHGNDRLGWKPVKPKTARDDVRPVTQFTEWCAQNFGHYPLNPVEERFVSSLNVKEQKTFYRALAYRKAYDKLAHLVPATKKGQGLVQRPAYVPPRTERATATEKAFPAEKVFPLIAQTPSTRDRLVFILLFFGALRISEPLHFYVTDVRRAADGSALVVLAHPESSTYDWVDEFRGNQRGTREAFLKERYGLRARNRLSTKNPLHTGWKGMDLESTKGEIVWLLPEMGRYFYSLHVKYMFETRRHVADSHPFYFVNEQSEKFGSPVKLSNMTKAFERAARRVGLSPSDDGVNPHGARHFFGNYCASELKLSQEETQILIRHESILSTQVYYKLKRDAAYRALRKGQAELAAAKSPFIAEAEKLLNGNLE